MEKGIINGEVAGGRRVEDGKLSVLNSCSEEVGDRVSTGMERHCIEWGVLGTSPLNMNSITNAVVMDVLGDFLLISFVNED